MCYNSSSTKFDVAETNKGASQTCEHTLPTVICFCVEGECALSTIEEETHNRAGVHRVNEKL